MTRRRCLSIALAACALLAHAGAASADFTITANYTDDPTDLEKGLFQKAIEAWEKVLAAPGNANVHVTITVTFTDLGTSLGGFTQDFHEAPNGFPTSASMTINSGPIMDYTYTLPLDPSKVDALTVMEHELGHALGFAYGTGINGYTDWDNRIVTGTDLFDLNGMFIKMSGTDDAGLSHVDSSMYPGDLMNASLGPGERKTISTLDVAMLEAAFGYVPEPSSFALAAVGVVVLAGHRLRRRRADAA